MRTTEERIRLIKKRTAELKQEKARQNQRSLSAACVAVCLLLIGGIGALMPGLMADRSGTGAMHTSGAASLLGSHAALGYILMGMLSFLLGICVTVLLYRLRRRDRRCGGEDGGDEF